MFVYEQFVKATLFVSTGKLLPASKLKDAAGVQKGQCCVDVAHVTRSNIGFGYLFRTTPNRFRRDCDTISKNAGDQGGHNEFRNQFSLPLIIMDDVSRSLQGRPSQRYPKSATIAKFRQIPLVVYATA
jgi:hypothetical protein